MKRVSKALVIVFACFVGSAAAVPSGTSAKVQRFANPELCYLDVAANEHDAQLVRAELQRRDVACTSELRFEGKQAIEHTVRRTIFQATSVSLQRAREAREIRDRKDAERSVRCARQTQDYSYCH